MTPCADYLPLLSDRAAGALSPADEARLAGHLAGCAACRAEGEALATVLAMAALPPPTEAERGALAGLAEAVRLEQRRAELRRWSPLRYAVATLAVAAAVSFLVAPAFFHRGPRLPAGGAAAEAAWELPSADDAWSAAELAADDGAAAAMASADELAMDALLADEP
jgi:predicted anti-sigma-YlaC factor YlaD